MQNAIYEYGPGLYFNLTNKCPCECAFCVRAGAQGLGSAGSLWLSEEPTAAQVISQLADRELAGYADLCFCGFGEPFCAFDTMLEICVYLKSRKNCPPVRVNTNGLGDLINGRHTPPLLAGLVDVISISLNAPTKERYTQLCRPEFGEGAFEAMLKFARECTEHVPLVALSVVDVISPNEIAACQKIADGLGIPLRVRGFSG